MTTKTSGDIDGLFGLPLADFTAARNVLAARLKREGHSDEAERVKSFAKPSVSAWAVNQLYWKHRKEFERLMQAGQKFREAQASQLAGTPADTKRPAEARQEAISELLRVAAGLLREGGHNPSPETMRRIKTTLEAMSAYGSVPDAPHPGQLTEDLEAPGFDALTALFSGQTGKRSTRTVPAAHTADERDVENKRRAEVTAVKVALNNARQTLKKAEARACVAESELKKASADLQQAEKRKREAEERLRDVSVAAQGAAKALEDARRVVEQTSRKLELLAEDGTARRRSR